MKKYAVFLAMVVVLFIFASRVSVFANDIVWDDIGRGNLNLRTVLVNPDNPRIIYIGAKGCIFKSEDSGESYRPILSIKSQNKEVNSLSLALDKNCLYAATGNGLFFSSDQGKNWKRIFKGKNYLENDCTSIAVLSAAIYLGTKGGLFVSRDNGRTWHKQVSRLGNSHILAIATNFKEANNIYVASIDGVFKTQDAGKSWERTFVGHPEENGSDIEEKSEDRDEEEGFSDIRYISIDPNNLNYLYLATARGVYKSQDRGATWQLLSSYGLLERDVKFLLVDKNSNLYAAGKSGVFEYRDERWQELSLRLAVEEIGSLTLDNKGNLYAACDKGLFKTNIVDSCDTRQNNPITLYYKDEPPINKIQQAAIQYAEVEPGKISRWRKQAAKKAWLPQVSLGVNRNTTDLWHWEGGSTTKNDDDILRRGRDSIDWDATLSWNLGELIWNDDQTNIDVRSRLMVELRQDILDDVTKLYFERLRVKTEIDNLSIEERKKRIEKELRLEELTASLDALTGGYFSQQLKLKARS